jgi:hypothetical protein
LPKDREDHRIWRCEWRAGHGLNDSGGARIRRAWFRSGLRRNLPAIRWRRVDSADLGGPRALRRWCRYSPAITDFTTWFAERRTCSDRANA